VSDGEEKPTSNLMDLPELERALALLGIALLVPLHGALAMLVLPYTDTRQYLDLEVAELGLKLLSWLGGLWFCLLLLGFHAKRYQRPYRYIVWMFVFSYAIALPALVYIVGLYSTPLWLVFAAGLMLALLLVDRVIVHTAALVGTTLLAAASIGERSGWLPHAPLFIRPPYTDDGVLDAAWSTSMAISSWILLLVIWLIGDSLVSRWRRREETFMKLSTVDSLTGLANRRHFMDVMRHECRRAERAGRPISLLMFDADHFKNVNDNHGHGVGDEVLVGLAQVLTEGIREFADLVGRLGGEEFAVLLPDADLAVAISVAERIRKTAEGRDFDFDGEKFSVTVSVGAASSSSVGYDPTALLHVADVMLYRSKKTGRNRVSWNDAA
jgi:diguanylate cyclase (GGDEF)-like protein